MKYLAIVAVIAIGSAFADARFPFLDRTRRQDEVLFGDCTEDDIAAFYNENEYYKECIDSLVGADPSEDSYWQELCTSLVCDVGGTALFERCLANSSDSEIQAQQLYFEAECGQNPDNGLYCGGLLNSNIDIVILSETQCPSISNCSTECRNTLEMLADRLGCCGNNFYNNTNIYMDPILGTGQANQTNYALWKECGLEDDLPDPQFCYGTSESLVKVFGDCTAEMIEAFYNENDYYKECIDSLVTTNGFTDNSYWQELCTSENCDVGGTALFEICYANTNEEEKQARHVFFQAECGQNPDNELYCGGLVYNYLDLLISSETQCSDASSCSAECRNTLQTLADELGCCGNNFYNNSEIYIDPILGTGELFQTSYALWKVCDLEDALPNPRFCYSESASTKAASSVGLAAILSLVAFLF